MSHRPLFLIAVLLLCHLPFSADAQDRPRLAVLDLKAKEGFTAEQASTLTGILRTAIHQTGAFDLHWQALAKKHGCALLAPSYEQPQETDCQRWCDPRNGSDATFQQALVDLGNASGHRELASIPWALWGHSGGGTWCGCMTLMHPTRVVATWMLICRYAALKHAHRLSWSRAMWAAVLPHLVAGVMAALVLSAFLASGAALLPYASQSIGGLAR